MKANVQIFFALFVLLISAKAHSGLVFSIDQIPMIGTPAVFQVLVLSDVPNQSLTGVDFTISLSSPGGAGGTFVSGTNSLLIQGGYFPGSFPGTSATFSSAPSTVFTIGTSNTILSTVTLGTNFPAVLQGTYSVSLSGLDAVDSTSTKIPSSAQGPFSYQVAVPEPSSVVLMSILCLGLYGFRRIRNRIS